ncbi:MAG: hypothetical protein GY851_31260 [bacterium]|nr:hypothetical protein [bacterium]
MNDKERFIACALGEPVDRPPFWLYFEPWASTLRRWKAEGNPEDVIDHASSFEPDFPPLPLPVNCGPCPKQERTVVEEDDETVVYRDGWGILCREFKTRESMPEFLEFPVKSRKDWEAFREEYLDPDHPDRATDETIELAETWAACGLPVQLGNFPDTGVFGGLRWLLGDEECLMAFCTQPDLVQEIMEHLTSIWLTVYEKVCARAEVACIHFWEDMCGRQGPLIGPDLWREFMGPQYHRIQAFAEKHNIPVISVDTDGDPDLIIAPMMETGVNFLFPMEVAAGCDVNAVQAKYPGLAMMGGIDKRPLAQGREAIDRELERIRPAVARGRYVPGLDHTVPDDVSWEDYKYYAESLKQLVGKE